MLLRALVYLVSVWILVQTVGCQPLEIKPILIAVPDISQSYDIVHESLYQDDSIFSAKRPTNFYVEKASREKPGLLNPGTNAPAQSKSSQLVFQNPPKKDTKQATTLTVDSSNKHLKLNALDTNRDNLIQWMVQPTTFPPMFVVQNGMQVQLTEAPLKGASTVEYVQEGKFPNTSSPQRPASKPIDKREPINKPQPQIIEGHSPQKPASIPPSHLNKQATQSNFSQQIEKQRLTQHRKNLLMISLVVIVLLVVFVLARSQRYKKKDSMSQLHSRFEQYREEEQLGIFKEEEQKGFEGQKGIYEGRGLNDDDYSDQDEMPTQQNTLIE